MTELIGKILITKLPDHFNKIRSYITLTKGISVEYQIIIKGLFHCKDGRIFGEKGKYLLALLASSYNKDLFVKLIENQVIDSDSMIFYDDIVEEDLKETPYGTRIKNARYYGCPSKNFNNYLEKIGYASDTNLITDEAWNKYLKSLPSSKRI